jgi:hypothetical protein
VVHEEVVQLPHVQQLFDGVEARRLLRVAVAHVVEATRWVRNEGHGHRVGLR